MKYYRNILIYCCMAMALSSISVAQTWTSLNGPQITTNVKDISIVQFGTDAGNKLYTAENSYVLKSTTGGTAWFGTGNAYSAPLFVLVKPDDAQKVVAVKNGELVYNSSGGGASWATPIEDQNLIPLRLIAGMVDKNVMLLGRKYHSGDKSVWRSSDGGAHWIAVTNFTHATDVTDFAPYPDEDGHRDGVVWACGSDPNGASQGQNKTASAGTRGLWTSNDYGVTWTASTLGEDNLVSMAIIPKSYPNSYYLYAVSSVTSANDIVYKSTNGASSWSSCFSGTAAIRTVRLDLTTEYLYLATNAGVYRSTNEGSNWDQKISGMESDIDILSIGIDSYQSYIYAGTANTLYRSTDNGNSWQNVGDMNVASVAFSGASVWGITRDNAYVSKFNGSSWTNMYIQSAGASFSAENIFLKSTGDLFVAGSLDGNANLQRSNDAGANYSQVYAPASGGGNFYGTTEQPNDASKLYTFGGATVSGNWENVFNSTNGGTNWQDVSWSPLGSSNAYVRDFRMLDGSTMFAAMSNGDILRTVNGGTNWSNPAVKNVGSVAYTIAIQPSQTSVVYAGGSSGIWKSTDGGANWGSALRNDAIVRIIFDPRYPADANHIWALAADGQNIYFSNNGGDNWSTLSTTGVPKPINDIKSLNSGYVYLATSDGVYEWNIEPAAPTGISRELDEGHPKIVWSANQESDLKATGRYKIYRYYMGPCSWQGFKIICDNDYPPSLIGSTTYTYFTDEAVVIIDPYDPPTGWFNKAIYFVKAVDDAENYSSQSGEVSDWVVDQEENKTVFRPLSELAKPQKFSLEANYPNPFNPVTQIKYSLPSDEYVTVKVYDILGKEVATLIDGVQSAGYKSIVFDASNLTSGVYYYRLQAGTFVKMEKMLLLK